VAYSAFLSHSSGDRALAEGMRTLAALAGVELYLAEHDVQPGSLLSEKVRAAIERSDIVVVLLTPSSYSSAYVHQEVGYAIRSDKFVLPVVELSVPRDALAMLEGVEYVPLDFNAPQQATVALAGQLKRRRTQKLRGDVIVAAILVTLLALALAQEAR
jgi:hypothetical protein